MVDINEQLDINEILKDLLQNKFKILFTTFIFSLLGIIYSLSLPNLFTSSAIIQIESSDNSSSISKSVAGVASLAGISISETNSRQSYITRLITSRYFFEKLYDNESFIIQLMASDGLEDNNLDLKLNQSIYNDKKREWNYKNANGIRGKPSLLTAQKVFKEHFTIEETKELDGFLIFKVTHTSPKISYLWLELLIDQFNLFLREKEVSEALISKDLLLKEISMNSVPEVKGAIANLIKDKIAKIVLSESIEDYALKKIDPPYLPEKKSSPNRPIICFIFLLVGFLVSCLYSLIVKRG